MNRLQDTQAGQAIWLDFITRQFMADGRQALICQSDGFERRHLQPDDFQKAFTGGKEYDEAISRSSAREKSSAQIFDLFDRTFSTPATSSAPVFDRTEGADGFVSLEVTPHFARDTQATMEETRRLFRAVNRPNVMIKIPGTKEGLPAIEQALGEGININITLIFSLQRYQEVMDAWLAGLERLSREKRKAAGVGLFRGELLREAAWIL